MISVINYFHSYWWVKEIPRSILGSLTTTLLAPQTFQLLRIRSASLSSADKTTVCFSLPFFIISYTSNTFAEASNVSLYRKSATIGIDTLCLASFSIRSSRKVKRKRYKSRLRIGEKPEFASPFFHVPFLEMRQLNFVCVFRLSSCILEFESKHRWHPAKYFSEVASALRYFWTSALFARIAAETYFQLLAGLPTPGYPSPSTYGSFFYFPCCWTRAFPKPGSFSTLRQRSIPPSLQKAWPLALGSVCSALLWLFSVRLKMQPTKLTVSDLRFVLRPLVSLRRIAESKQSPCDNFPGCLTAEKKTRSHLYPRGSQINT